MSDGLVLSGGGRNGAFAAGVTHRLISEYGIKFTAVSGTSTGALKSSLVITDNTEIINELYRGGVSNANILQNRNIITRWLLGSLGDQTPLHNLIKRYVNLDHLRKAWDQGKRAIVTIVNLRTGSKEIYDSSPQNMPLWHKYVLASASIPGLMQPVQINGDDYCDGGLRDNMPIMPLLTDRSINRIFAINNCPIGIEKLAINPVSLSDRIMRAFSIMSTETAEMDTSIEHKAFLYNKEIIMFEPDRYLGNALDFNKIEMKKIWQEGFDKAKKIMDAIYPKSSSS